MFKPADGPGFWSAPGCRGPGLDENCASHEDGMFDADERGRSRAEDDASRRRGRVGDGECAAVCSGLRRAGYAYAAHATERGQYEKRPEAVGRRHSAIRVRRDAFVVRPLGRREAVQPCADRWRQHSVLHRGQTS